MLTSHMRAPVTPSSLKWLITRRARLDGELGKVHENELIRQRQFAESMKNLRYQISTIEIEDKHACKIFDRVKTALSNDLAATDLLLQQHEVSVDPSLIKSIRSQEALSETDYGQLTRLIYECLRNASKQPCNATYVPA
jgi:hypothetical protein